MSENILNDFVQFLEKSATVIGGQTNSIEEPKVLSGIGGIREAKTDLVNNSTSPQISNPSQGAPQGVPLKAQALKPPAWEKNK
jgi:hypothetical protein